MTDGTERRRSDCPIDYALGLFGDAWTLLILRDLLLKNRRRFRELAADEGIATNILADRLKRLETQGVITREADPADRRQVLYRVTEKGVALVPVLLEITAWGATYDERTAAPGSFVRAYRADRAGTIRRFVRRLRDS